DIDGEAKAIIERINAFKRPGRPVLSVDVPSGIDGETGKIRGAAVEASASVTFFRLKPGHLLLPGRTLAGAIRLAARAALRAGAGIVSVASPADAVAVNAAHLTAVMVAPFADAREFEALLADERRRAIALGPGAGVGATLRKLVAAALTKPAKDRTIVLDADALTSFAGDAARLAALIKRGGHQAVMTPHEGEFAKLFEGVPDVRLEDDKLSRARAAARL